MTDGRHLSAPPPLQPSTLRRCEWGRCAQVMNELLVDEAHRNHLQTNPSGPGPVRARKHVSFNCQEDFMYFGFPPLAFSIYLPICKSQSQQLSTRASGANSCTFGPTGTKGRGIKKDPGEE